ncbi:MAG: hypothetical protein OD815_001058 [Candidatus Alkanophagales archaeon MCA70_species_2]|nr:hypothetical protein [Candidatus Alkanophaga liquidiphilum]
MRLASPGIKLIKKRANVKKMSGSGRKEPWNAPLLQILNNLSAYISEHKVLSEEELWFVINKEVEKLSGDTRVELETALEGGSLPELIFQSITTHEKLSVFSPDLHVKLNYQGEIFYCPPSHRFMHEEIEKAFLRLAFLRAPLDEMCEVLSDFLERAGYNVSEIERKDTHVEMSAEKRYTYLKLFLLPTVNYIPTFLGELKEQERLEEGKRTVLVVPTERTPLPFIRFFREFPLDEDILVWVTDVQRGAVNPFIGNPEDEDIESCFENPDRARHAVGIWMRKMQIPDEEF